MRTPPSIAELIYAGKSKKLREPTCSSLLERLHQENTYGILAVAAQMDIPILEAEQEQNIASTPTDLLHAVIGMKIMQLHVFNFVPSLARQNDIIENRFINLSEPEALRGIITEAFSQFAKVNITHIPYEVTVGQMQYLAERFKTDVGLKNAINLHHNRDGNNISYTFSDLTSNYKAPIPQNAIGA
jgi:hypothetical protein